MLPYCSCYSFQKPSYFISPVNSYTNLGITILMTTTEVPTVSPHPYWSIHHPVWSSFSSFLPLPILSPLDTPSYYTLQSKHLFMQPGEWSDWLPYESCNIFLPLQYIPQTTSFHNSYYKTYSCCSHSVNKNTGNYLVLSLSLKQFYYSHDQIQSCAHTRHSSYPIMQQIINKYSINTVIVQQGIRLFRKIDEETAGWDWKKKTNGLCAIHTQ